MCPATHVDLLIVNKRQIGIKTVPEELRYRFEFLAFTKAPGIPIPPLHHRQQNGWAALPL